MPDLDPLVRLIGEHANGPYDSHAEQVRGLEEFHLKILAAERAVRKVQENVKTRRRKRPSIQWIYEQCLREIQEQTS